MDKNKTKKIRKGKVVSDKLDKTIVVVINRYEKDPKYIKRFKKSKKYKVHDPEGKYKVGDMAEFVECKPISKDKHFVVTR